MKTDDRNGNVSRVRIAVLGSGNVGKSALTVRYLTRRFIGEYRSNTDLLYRQIVTVNNMPLEVEIVDVSGEAETSFPSDQVAWADGCLIVYSVTDRQSFLYAEECLRHFQHGDSPSVQTVLLANKMDLEHLREVEEVEGRELSKQYGCQFHEISVAEDSSSLYKAFEHLVTECRVLLQNTKTRKFSVSKMIGTLIGTQKSITPQEIVTRLLVQRLVRKGGRLSGGGGNRGTQDDILGARVQQRLSTKITDETWYVGSGVGISQALLAFIHAKIH